MSDLSRSGQGFLAGSLIGTLEAVILNKAMSLVVVSAALLFRGGAISPDLLAPHLHVVLNLLAGSLVGAWWAAGHAIRLPRHWLDRIVMLLMLGLALVMLAEAWSGRHAGSPAPLLEPGALRLLAGVLAGLLIGMVAGSVLGAALGGLLLGAVPTAWLTTLLGALLLVSAVKTFQHAR